MTQQLLDDGSAPNAGDGTSLLAGAAIINANFTELYTLIRALSWKQGVRAATAVAGTLASSFENGDTIDGVTLATGDRILIKDQAAPAENGIYTVNASGAPTRAVDADSSAELVNATVYVSEGSTNADKQFTCTTNAPITVNTTGLTWTLLSVSSGSAKPFITFRPRDNEPPTSNPATLDLRNNHPVLEFDQTTGETAIFSSVMPTGYAGGSLIVSCYYCAEATSGTVGWLVAFERIDVSSLDIDADSFASDQTITAATVPGTQGQILKSSVTITAGSNIDSLAAGEAFRLRIKRDVATDTCAADAQLLRVTVEEA